MLFRNGALSHRLKPLGQNDWRIGALCFPHDASRVAERSMTNPNPLLGRLKPGWQSMGKGKSCGLAPTPFRNGTLSRRRSRAQFAIERGASSVNARGRAPPRLHHRKSELNQALPDALGRAVSGRFQHPLPLRPRQDLNLRSPAPQADDFATKRKNSVKVVFRHAREQGLGLVPAQICTMARQDLRLRAPAPHADATSIAPQASARLSCISGALAAGHERRQRASNNDSCVVRTHALSEWRLKPPP